LGFAFSATYFQRDYKGGINIVISPRLKALP
jgi:hypothetical protein